MNSCRFIKTHKRIRTFICVVWTFTPKLIDISIRLMIDNSTVLCYINKFDGTKSRRLFKMAEEIVACVKRGDLRFRPFIYRVS